jgi:hypothetical protein
MFFKLTRYVTSGPIHFTTKTNNCNFHWPKYLTLMLRVLLILLNSVPSLNKHNWKGSSATTTTVALQHKCIILSKNILAPDPGSESQHLSRSPCWFCL